MFVCPLLEIHCIVWLFLIYIFLDSSFKSNGQDVVDI